MKKAFLLLEVLISILLIFGVVFALFQIKENNFFLFERISKNAISNSALSMVALNNNDVSNENRNIYLDDVINEYDETFRTTFKSLRVKLEEEQEDIQNVLLNNQSIEVSVMKTQLQMDDTFNKSFYTIKID